MFKGILLAFITSVYKFRIVERWRPSLRYIVIYGYYTSIQTYSVSVEAALDENGSEKALTLPLNLLAISWSAAARLAGLMLVMLKDGRIGKKPGPQGWRFESIMSAEEPAQMAIAGGNAFFTIKGLSKVLSRS